MVTRRTPLVARCALPYVVSKTRLRLTMGEGIRVSVKDGSATALGHFQRIEHAFVLELDRARHQDAIAGGPLDQQRPARQRDRNLPAGEPLARRAHRRRTGGTAARLGEARAALPRSQR